jgi:HEAT repeat protein
VDPLIAALESELRPVAAPALVRIGPLAVDRLGEALCGRFFSCGARAAAAQILGKIGDNRAVESLIRALRDRDSPVREAAASALETIGPPAVKPLIEALNDSRPDVRWAATRMLGRMGAPAVEPLTTALHNPSSQVRRVAAQLLKQMG